MEFREIRKEEWKECASVQTESFMDYDYFTIPFPDAKKRHAFLYALMSVGTRIFSSEGILLGCFDSGKMAAAAFIAPPQYRPAGLPRYIANGGLKVIAAGGIGDTFEWLSMDDDATSAVYSMKEPHWLLESLNVLPEYKYKGIGSRMLSECILPYMRERGGKKVCLITNSKDNARFYEKNGFKKVEYREIHFRKRTMGNWTYEKDLF